MSVFYMIDLFRGPLLWRRAAFKSPSHPVTPADLFLAFLMACLVGILASKPTPAK